MNDYPRVSYAATGQSWPMENWVPHNAAEDRRSQTTFYPDKVQNWRLSDLPAEQQLQLGMSFDVSSVEPNRAPWPSDDRKTLDHANSSQQHVKEAIAEWKLRDGQDPDCAEFERLRTPTYTIVESG